MLFQFQLGCKTLVLTNIPYLIVRITRVALHMKILVDTKLVQIFICQILTMASFCHLSNLGNFKCGGPASKGKNIYRERDHSKFSAQKGKQEDDLKSQLFIIIQRLRRHLSTKYLPMRLSTVHGKISIAKIPFVVTGEIPQLNAT